MSMWRTTYAACCAEINLDENITREDLHSAGQFEQFHKLSEDRGWDAEEIAARFGVTSHVEKQQMRLGAAASPKLLQVYRDGELTLDQLMVFAITDDHARQEEPVLQPRSIDHPARPD